MSIIRFSCLKETLFAPDGDGNLVPGAFDPNGRTGCLGKFEPPGFGPGDSPLAGYLGRALEDAADELADDQPVVVMAHGFLFDPKQSANPVPADSDNPHSRVYHFQDRNEAEEQKEHTTSWLLHLGFEPDDRAGASRLAVAFGWHSQPGFAQSLLEYGQNFYARAYDFAERSAWPFANVLDELARRLPDRRIDIVTHSLGARLVVRALALAAKHQPAIIERIDRIVILGGSEYVFEAQLLYQRLEGLSLAPDRGPTVYNFVSYENDVLDVLAENFGARFFGNSQVIGHNGFETTTQPARWMDLQIDDPELQTWMAARHGIEISGDRPGNVWDHWYYYTFRGNLALYRAILRNRDTWTLAALRKGDDRIPEGVRTPVPVWVHRRDRAAPRRSGRH